MIPAELLADLSERGLPVCLIGAAALSVHGFSRYSVDVDLLTVDRRALSELFWRGAPFLPEVRRGDDDDPLAGVVRWKVDPPVDLVVGKGHAARFAIETAEARAGVPCLVATPLALALLKLEAGSPQDCADVLSLAVAQRELNGARWIGEIEGQLTGLSKEARRAWESLRPELARLEAER